MDKFDRLLDLHRLLAGRRTPLPTERIMERLECSQVTAQRLCRKLRDELGAPLKFDRAAGGWLYEADVAFELPGLWFSAAELSALAAAQVWLGQIEPGLIGGEIAPLVSRIDTLLERAQPGGGHLADKIRLVPVAARHVDDRIFRVVAGSLAAGRRLAFDYRGRARDDATRREVSPQRLTWYRSNWYLDAWCHLRAGMRRFALDRIAAPALVDTPAQVVPVAELDAYAESYGIFSGAAASVATLRFSAEAARWVADEQWHPRQQGRRLDDGRYELDVPYSQPQELVMDILRHGPDVEVVAPPALRTAVRERLAAALGRYS